MFPPDRRGLLHENDVRSLLAFRELREKEFANELACSKKTRASGSRGRAYSPANVNDGDPETYWALKDGETSGWLEVDLGKETEINRILVQEYIKLGQRIQEFRVEALTGEEWKPLVEGTTVGYKIIRKFPVVRASSVRFSVTKAKASPLISNIEIYRAPGE